MSKVRDRRLLAVVAVVALLLVAGCDWTQFGYQGDHTRTNADNGISKANVASLHTAWTATTGAAVASSPAVANGVAYVGSYDNKLYAFDAVGSPSCTGTPPQCTPLWTATTGGLVRSSPAVANGVVFVGSDDGKLYAFDAAGSTNCGGTPKFCLPLWTATTGGPVSSPTVANGKVYVGSYDSKLYVFDAAGSTNCGGIVKQCLPLWTAPTGDYLGTSPAVTQDVVYVASASDKLLAFDAAGSTGCGGSPVQCLPLWSANVRTINSSPAVSNGKVYLGSVDGNLYVFDAAGSTGCGGAPKVCAPLWTAAAAVQADFPESSPAVAGGVVYIGGFDGRLYAFDAAGSTRCTGTPKKCVPLWTSTLLTNTADGGLASSPAAVNGLVYIGSIDGHLYALDAGGSVGCTGTTQKTCAPLWSATTGAAVDSSPAVANGMVYVGSGDHKLYAFAP